MRRDPCPTCGTRTKYAARYDRFLCPTCRTWTDEPCDCSEADCPFPRPFEKPTEEDLEQAEEI